MPSSQNGVELTNPQPLLTAFQQMTVAEERVVIWSNFANSIPSQLWTTTVAGTGTVSRSNGRAVVSSGANGSAVLRSIRAIRYLPGQGVIMRMTCPMPAITAADGVVYIGLGNLTNGIGIGRDRDNVFIWVANNGVLTPIYRDRWIGMVPVDTNFAFGSPMTIAFQWLGYGAQAIGFGLPNGQIVPAHVIEYANTSSETWTRNPSFEAFVRASSTTGDVTIYTPSIGVFTQGPLELAGIARGEDNVMSVTAAAGTFMPVISMRCAATLNGGTNLSRLILSRANVTNENSTQLLRCLVLRSPTLGGPTAFNSLEANQAITEFDIGSNTVTFTSANIIDSFGVGPNGSNGIDFLSRGIQIPPSGIITLAVAKTAAAAFKAYGSLSVIEQL